MRFGFVGGSYSAQSSAIADEECINWYAETIESQGSIVGSKAYGGQSTPSLRSYLSTPGLHAFVALPNSPVRAQCFTGTRLFAVGGSKLYEVLANGTANALGDVTTDGQAAVIVASSVQLLVISAGRAYCFDLGSAVLTDVTASLAGTPIQADYSDGYFIVCFANSNKFQMSAILDGTTWPGIQVNAVSVFPENITSILVSHRELWVFGAQHTQPYQDTGSDQIFDVIPGTLIEKGCIATYGRNRVDNTVFWVDEDERGGRSAWRASGYTPQRISTHAVEVALSSYANISSLVSYSYQDKGHLFWVLYVPGADCTWVYDVAENLWHKRATWNTMSATFGPHKGWNHSYAFGKHLVGDWNSGNIYQMDASFLDDNGTAIRRLRRAPTVSNEMQRLFHAKLTVDFDTGLGPAVPLVDGNGNPRSPQAMLRWSDTRGKTWSNEHILDCGMAGQYKTRVIWRRLGHSRYRVYELSVTDAIPWTIVDAYLELAGQ